MAEFISLYSGSSGNSSVVRCGSRYLIVDMGKGVRTTSAALKALGLAVSDCECTFSLINIKSTTIAKGVYIKNIDVSGLTKSEDIGKLGRENQKSVTI